MGLNDTILAISEEAGRLGTVRQRTEVVTVSQLRDEIEACKELARFRFRQITCRRGSCFRIAEKRGVGNRRHR